MQELTPQQKDALDFKSHILLTANAGSGKTFVLSKRFVEILLNEDIDLTNIVAITFTDKAAGELNKKIAAEIDQRIQSEINSEKRNKLESFRRQLVSANISTIHSFCINILKEFAPEAKIDANFSPIDQPTANELIELCTEETISSLIKNLNYAEDLKYLVRFFGSKNNFISELENSIHQRRIISKLKENIYSKSENEIVNFFRKSFAKGFDEIFSSDIEHIVEVIQEINAEVLHKGKANDTANEIQHQISNFKKNTKPLEQILILDAIRKLVLTTEGTVRIKGYLANNRDNFLDEITEIESLFQSLRNFFDIKDADKSEKELAHFGKTFLKIFEYASNLYAEKKKQKGYLDFEDILLFTQQILKQHDVQSYLREKFRYIMIDEYQDTNELQYEIFMPILDDLRSGNLFVVGDEKQSIYMFRNAELEVFNKTKNEISNSQNTGRVLSLPHSFRMTPEIVLFTNKLFSKLFENANPIFNEVEYNELICAKDETEKGSVEFLLTDAKSNITESDLVTSKILVMLNQGAVELKDIAILCRKRDSFAELEKSFVQHKIPYSIIGGKGFYQRQTIYDVYNYFAFLLNEEDDSALVGILRSPFFNLSDLQIYEISSVEAKSFSEKLRISSESQPEFKYAYEKLKENLKIAFSTEIYTLIRKILLESGYWSIIAAKQNSVQELANVEKLLLLARGFSKKSFKNLYDFTVFLRESIKGYEDEGQAQIAKDENSVKILTIHQAKGLEFNTVFLYRCNDSSQDSIAKSKSLSIDKNFGLIAKAPIENDYFSKYSTAPIVALYNYTIHKKTIAEIKRLLYVGVTRAINYLFITATHKDFKSSRDSFFELFSDGLNSDFQEGEIQFTSNVKFMNFTGKEFKFFDKNLSIRIPINNKIEETIPIVVKKDAGETEKLFLTQRIKDIPKNEIISATKISMFTQCPVKYQLTYELGFPPIYQLVKDRLNDFEFNLYEDDELRQYAQLRGKLVHEILKEEIKENALIEFIENRLSVENFSNKSTKQNLVSSIADEIKRFYFSAAFGEISAHSNYKNEFEIYSEEGEHFLYGIIDKLIIEKDKLIIIDYKTDNVSLEALKMRAEDYFPQLTFYAYVLSKLYSEVNTFELRLIFLKHTDEKLIMKIYRDDLKNFGINLNEAIHKIFSGDFNMNFNHCLKCHFALEGNRCVRTIS